jgi:hypothetical protein
MESLKTTGSLGKVCRRALGAAAAFLLSCGIAQATIVFTGALSINAADPTQLGRLVLNGDIQDWAGGAAFPGVNDPTTSYHFVTLDLDLSSLEAGYVFGGFLQIGFFSSTNAVFLAAYRGSYDPTDLSVNWLGDEGYGGNNFVPFQIIAGATDHLILVMEETNPGEGLGVLGSVTIEAFSDTSFTDLVRATPEPGTLGIFLFGLGLLMAARRSSARAARVPRP